MIKIVALLVALCISVFSQTIKLTSLYWPPYSGEELKEQGLSTLIAKKAFEAVGYELKVEFYPWKRAVALSNSDSEYMGYIPEYKTEDTKSRCILSDSIGSSPLGIVEPSSSPIKWQEVDDLSSYTIGVVQGYVNTDRFDALAKRGDIKTEAVINDAINIRKVAHKRVDGAIIDKNLLEYMLLFNLKDENLSPLVNFNQKLLENKTLHICFTKTKDGKRVAEIFNKGLKKIDIESIESEYLKGL